MKYDNSLVAAEAIMTTDTKVKTIAVEFDVDGTTCHIGGICKGSGMIHPNMGTMLCFITTDCAVSSEMIRKALLFNVKRTFNRVTVDGDTSTNDMCTVLANGMAGNAEITAEDPAYEAFREALQTVMQDLARKIAADGEGASKLMTCTVKGAKDEETAEVLAKSIAGSSLTKAAMFGSDANWGRVLCAMGYSGAEFNTEKVLVEFASKEGSIAVCDRATAAPRSSSSSSHSETSTAPPSRKAIRAGSRSVPSSIRRRSRRSSPLIPSPPSTKCTVRTRPFPAPRRI